MSGNTPDSVAASGSQGAEHFFHNLSQTEPIGAIGIYIGAGSVEETGYAYVGDVTEADIQARTGP